MRIETVTDETGRRVVEKRAETSEEAARLRREADLFNVAGHPGMVELIGFEDGPQPRLRTGFLEGGALSERPPLEIEEVAGVVAALASTIADLHAMGLVHGALAPERVVLDEDGRPVLCSLGYGGLAGERPPALPALPPPYADPARSADAPLDPAFDVFGVGAMLGELVARVSGHPRRATVDALDRLAERATAAVSGDRPSARSLADAVHDTVVGARLPRHGAGARAGRAAVGFAGDVPDRERPLERWRQAHTAPVASRSRPVMVVPVAALAVIAVGFVASRARLGDQAAPRAAEREGPAPSGGPALAVPPSVTSAEGPPPPVTTTTVVVAPAAPAPAPRGHGATGGCGPLDAVLSADVDGDGCAEAVRYSQGVLEADGLRWAVGQSGDQVAIGDWSCHGSSSVALLRPATGEIFAFEGWASAGRDLQAPLVGRVGGGQQLRAADVDGDGCHELVVERSAGAPVVLRARPGSVP
ncbi:MAG: hypothetical protein M3314_12910 [Actinomycetota bacterium]|nr:hypothetical protein [Actinomycetota bacterium]